MKIKIKCSPKFRTLYELPEDTNMVILIGGRGGMKTYEASKFAAFAATCKKKRVAIMRDEKETIRESILNEIFARFDTANRDGHFNGRFSKIETGIRNEDNGEMAVFTKGFRASSNEKTANLKGVSEVDIAIVEEAEDIRSFNKFNVMKDSIRTQGRLIIVILNTPDIQHWIVKRYFNLKVVEDGYWELIPKKIKGFHCIQTNYKDNPYLPEDVVRDYEGYGDKNSHLYDEHYYKTAILGYASSGRKGQILTKVKSFTLVEYLKLQYREVYGLDFGTSSPAGLVGAKIHRDNMWVRELNYKPLDLLGIGKLLCTLGIGSNDIIIADSAEPTSIGKLRRGWIKTEISDEDAIKYPQLLKGWNIRGAIKGPGSIASGIGKLKSMNLFFCEESQNLWNEVYNYIYAQNKEGEYINEPVDSFNHLIDPVRYIPEHRGRTF